VIENEKRSTRGEHDTLRMIIAASGDSGLRMKDEENKLIGFLMGLTMCV